jgi:nicotinamide riboside transporter PnuC
MWWSWTLAAIGVTGLYLVTRRNWRGYVLGVGVQVLWIAYAVVTAQWGFIASALVYGAVNMIGLVGWRKAERRADRQPKHRSAQQKVPVLPAPPPPPPPARK